MTIDGTTVGQLLFVYYRIVMTIPCRECATKVLWSEEVLSFNRKGGSDWRVTIINTEITIRRNGDAFSSPSHQ